MRRVNVFDDDCPLDGDEPDGYLAGAVRISKVLGAGALAVKVYEVPPGQNMCPYDYRCDSDVYAHGSGHGLGIGRHGSRRQSA
jgi:hypothetical protein